MEERFRKLLKRADRAFGAKPVSDAVGKVRAIIGLAKFPPGEELAEEAMNALRNGEVPTPKQLAALERMINLMRPAPLCRGGVLDDLPDYNDYNAEAIEQWEKFRNNVQPFMYSIGRIDSATGEGIGTGFLVRPTLLVTNRHVLSQLSNGAEMLEEGQVVVRFKQEFGLPDDDPPVPVTGVVAVHSHLDIALLSVKETKPRRPLVLDSAVMDEGHPVAAVGYPFDDPVRNPDFIDVIYGDKFGVKRAAPGEVVGLGPSSVYHDCSTLGGNSGSPLFSMESAQVIGLHRSGFFMYRNEAVDGPSLNEFVSRNL
ncbi:MAG: trypsin-like serine peptidase [bacterium]